MDRTSKEFKKKQMEFVEKLKKAGYKDIKIGKPEKTLIDKELLIVKWWIFLYSF